MTTIHFISGLGADKRVFQKLDLPGYQANHIEWIPPLKDESIQSYSQRLLPQINEENPILIGVSFGGIIAQEIGKIIPTKKIIIISSVKSSEEFDWKLKMVKQLGIYHLPPPSLLKWMNLLIGDYYFGIKSEKESLLLKAIIEDTDKTFMKWAISALMSWQPNSSPDGLLHIHGSNDRIFRGDLIKDAIIIEGGGHFMVYNQARELSELIIKTLQE